MQTQPDGNNCEICGDNDHQAFECRHNPNAIQAAQPTGLEIIQQHKIEELLGGEDISQVLAILPERLDFDKKAGVWMAESLSIGMTRIQAKLIGATTGWAIWSERVGSPEQLTFGQKPTEPGQWEMGIRLIVEIEDNLFVWDAWGVCFKSAHSAIRRAQKFQGWFTFDGSKTISTRFGEFKVPTLTSVSEG